MYVGECFAYVYVMLYIKGLIWLLDSKKKLPGVVKERIHNYFLSLSF